MCKSRAHAILDPETETLTKEENIMKLRKLLCLVLALLMIAALTACSGGVTGGAPAEELRAARGGITWVTIVRAIGSPTKSG